MCRLMTLARKLIHSFGISAYENVPDAVREQRRSEPERKSPFSMMIRHLLFFMCILPNGNNGCTNYRQF